MTKSETNWRTHLFKDVYHWASKSKDPRTKIGAILVHWGEHDPIAFGYNGFPRRINDEVLERWERPEKYFWVCHAEQNAIWNCAKKGRATEGTFMLTQGIPCADCTKGLIQAGIARIIVHAQWQAKELEFDWKKWNESSERSKIMLSEVGIPVEVFDSFLGVTGYLDGKEIQV